MGKIKNENFYTIQGWMVNDLKLKGNELTIYAIIYGLSQGDGQYFTGSQQYLADWTNSTTRGVRKVLSSLLEKGFLEKRDKIINKVKYCEYKALIPQSTEQSSMGEEQSSTGYGTKFLGVRNKVPRGTEQSSAGGTEQSSANNIYINNIENNIEDNIGDSISEKPLSEDKPQSHTTSEDVKQVVSYYNQYCSSFSKVRIVSDARKRKIKARLKQYTLDDFINLFEKAEASSFLKGNNNRNWKATFDWMIEDAHMCKILEGNYDDRNDFESKKNEWLDWAGNE